MLWYNKMQQYNSYNTHTQEAFIVTPVNLYLTHITYSQYIEIVKSLELAYNKGVECNNTRQTSEMFSG